MDKITVVIRRDTGAIEITPQMVEEALNYYLGTEASVTVFVAAQPPRTADGAYCICENSNFFVSDLGLTCWSCKKPRR